MQDGPPKHTMQLRELKYLGEGEVNELSLNPLINIVNLTPYQPQIYK